MPTLPPGLSPGTIPYTGSGTDTAAERLAGYAVAMRAAGLEPHTIEGGFRSEAAHEAVRRLLDQSALPAALLVSNNLMMLGALKAVREAGLRVPDDLAIVGIGDPEWAALVDPPLTMMAVPVRGMPLDAMELLLSGSCTAETVLAGSSILWSSESGHLIRASQPEPGFKIGLAAGRSRCQGVVRRSAAGPG